MNSRTNSTDYYASNLIAQPANVREGENIDLTLKFGFSSGDINRKVDGKIKDQTLYVVCKDSSGQRIGTTVKLPTNGTLRQAKINTSGFAAGPYSAVVTTDDAGSKNYQDFDGNDFFVSFQVASRSFLTPVSLYRTPASVTQDQGLWVAIRNRTDAINFSRYQRFINTVFGCSAITDVDTVVKGVAQSEGITNTFRAFTTQPNAFSPLPRVSFQGPYAYSLLKVATQVFLAIESGVLIRDKDFCGAQVFDQAVEAGRLDLDSQDPKASRAELEEMLNRYLATGHERLPYLDRVADAIMHFKGNYAVGEVLPYCEGILQHRLTQPSMIELIWSYWHEEGMLAQTMNAIAFRFQNLRSSPSDPLGELELDPLRPLNNIIWGYVQDRHNRLTIARRAFEYDHHYGVKLVGKAVPAMGSADSRSKFFEAFHNLLYRTAVFYREDAETTVVADAFPLLNALKDVHLLLAEGAHNQYGDLPWTARAEMLTEQWMLARPEMREFLRGRHMVPYQEEWMGAVDAMKKLQGWTDTTITHFNELAVDGERLLLSIRFGDWSDLNLTEDNAKNWARYWKPEVQRYIYGYLAVTGVDLMADTTDSRDAAIRNVQPSLLLQRRLAAQTRSPALAARPAVARVGVGAAGFAALPAGLSPRALRQLKGQ